MAAKKTAKKTKKAPSRSKAPKKAKATPATAGAGAETLKMRSASPGFTVNDLEKSLAWYRDVLGFVVEEMSFHSEQRRTRISPSAENLRLDFGLLAPA